MPTPDLVRLYAESDALDLARLVRSGDVSAAELVEVAIAAIKLLDPQLNAVVIRTFEIARSKAASSPDGPFAGVPFLLKNIGSMWRGTPLNNGYRHMRNFVCGEDSELSERIRASGFLLLGRTNTPEGGWSLGTEPRLYGPTRNPYDLSLTPGGSSGGAAAAVASRMLPLAEASDGGGSIRGPAACCGLIGLKPSRGRITYAPRPADVWLGSVATFCVTRTVRDTAAYLDAVAGSAVGDPYVLPKPSETWLSSLDRAPRALRIGFTLDAPWGDPVAPEVRTALRETLALLESMGHHVEEYDLPVNLPAAWRSYNRISAVETAADIRRFERETGAAVDIAELAAVNAALVERGRSLGAVDHAESILAIRAAGREIAHALEPFDVFVTPTLTQPARPLGFWSMDETDLDRYLDRWADGAYLFAFNLAGLPALSVPAPEEAVGLPVGIQLVGRHGDESTLLRLAQQLEIATGWSRRKPPVSMSF